LGCFGWKADIACHRRYGWIMIEPADEFVRLRASDNPNEYGRAAMDEAPESVWFEIVRLYPQMRRWVAYNKTFAVSVLEVLAADEDEHVRLFVAGKRKLTPALFDLCA
jgi:hypothetical protein